MNDKVIDLLRALVEIPSVNPGCTGAPSEFTGEERIGNFLLEWAARGKIEAKRIDTAEGRPCVLMSIGPEDAPSLLLSAHMDTVWTRMENPFRLKEEGAFLHGLGAVDDKGPLAAALCAVHELSGKSLSLRFHLLATCDEEFGLTGIRRIIPEIIRPDGVIISEPTGLRVITAHKGSSRFTFRTTGKSAHSSLVRQGENAIYKAAKLIGALEKYSEQMTEEPPHPLLGTNTLCVGTVRGGTQTNMVPDECSFQINFRSLPGETPSSILARLQNALEHAGVDYDIPEKSFDASSLDTSPELPVIARLLKILRSAGLDPKVSGVPYATESFRPAEYGIPTIVFGPGDIDSAHTPGERIETSQLLRAVPLLVKFIEQGKWTLDDFKKTTA